MKRKRLLVSTRNKLISIFVALILALPTAFFAKAATNSAMGAFAAGTTADSLSGRYSADYASLAEARTAAKEVDVEVAGEGFVLLKNGNIADPAGPALPVATSADGKAKVSIFGKNSVNPVYGGSGSSGGTSAGDRTNVKESLEMANFEVNQTLYDFYGTPSNPGRPGYPAQDSYPAGVATGETPLSTYTTYDSSNADALTNSYATYNDMAIVYLARVSGEGYDLPRASLGGPADQNFNNGIVMYNNTVLNNDSTYDSILNGTYSGATIRGRSDWKEHYFEIDDNEKDLLTMVKSKGFKRVVVVLNSPAPMEMGFVDNPAYGVDAAIWVGLPGGAGLIALGKILNGEVNPSGKTVDTWSADFLADPAFQNYGNNGVEAVGSSGRPAGNQYVNTSGGHINAYEVAYEEGIYVGYRYYETRGYVEQQKVLASKPGATPAEQYDWYNKNVVYPLGYGLSYTSFSWAIQNMTPAAGAISDVNGNITVTVRVTNTGAKVGKDVVQLYFTSPYTNGKIEKSHVVLGAFAKTGIIAAGSYEDITLSMPIHTMASYDYNDANANGNKGYELDAGAYIVRLGKNAHESWQNSTLTRTYNIAATTNLPRHLNAGIDVKNQFDDISEAMTQRGRKIMSRADFEGTFPKAPTLAERTADMAYQNKWANPLSGTATAAQMEDYDADKPWYESEMPAYRKTEDAYASSGSAPIQLSDLIGKQKNDPLWDQYMAQFTMEQLGYLVAAARYGTLGMPAMGVPTTSVCDGPMGLVGHGSLQGGIMHVSPIVLASTWNIQLAEKLGKSFGNEALWIGISGVYAPAVNIHRSPFSGRNFEYYSEDGALSGFIGAGFIRGIQSKGIIPYVKHFFLNDQESRRLGILTFADEQTMREIYLLAFQLCVQDGGAMGLMTAFNRVGYEWAGASYAANTTILRKEWGFEGVSITDYYQGDINYMNTNLMIRAGGDYSLGNNAYPSFAVTPTHVKALQTAVKNLLYALAWSSIFSDAGVQNDVLFDFTLIVVPGKSVADTRFEIPADVMNAIGLTSSNTQYTFFEWNSVHDANGTLAGNRKLPAGMADPATSTTGARFRTSGTSTVAANEVRGTRHLQVGLRNTTTNRDYLMFGVHIIVDKFIPKGDTEIIIVPGGDNGEVGGKRLADVPVTYSIVSGNLPTGLSLDPDTGKILGTTQQSLQTVKYPITVKTSSAGLDDFTTDHSIEVLGTIEEELIAANQKIDDLQKEVDDLNNEVEKLDGEIAELEGAIDALEGEMTDEIERLEGLITTLTSEKTRLEGLITTLTSEKARLEGLITANKEKIESLTSENATQQTKIDELKNEVDELEKSIKDLNDKIAALEEKQSAGCNGSIAVSATSVAVPLILVVSISAISLILKRRKQK